MTTFVCNAFSLQMVNRADLARVQFEAIESPTPATLAAATSAVGHADTAALLGVPVARVNVALKEGDELLVAQFMGGRLPEGATTLPPGVTLQWVRVFLV